jgi:DNA-binding PucR family transcriptional regulator
MLTLSCGYSSSVELVELPRAIAEARAALELSRRRGGAVGPDALTSLEGLLEQQPVRCLSPFIDQLLTPLITSDDRHGTRHVETLRTFLRLGGSLQGTAKEQYLHINTVRHRLARIHLITGNDPLVFADRVALAIALWAYDRRQTDPNRAM